MLNCVCRRGQDNVHVAVSHGRVQRVLHDRARQDVLNCVCRRGQDNVHVAASHGRVQRVLHGRARQDVSRVRRRTLVNRRGPITGRGARVKNKKGYCEICCVQYDNIETVS